jgi:hypothetical protein
LETNVVNFPKTLANTVEILEPGIGELGDVALRRLHERGYRVATGLTEHYVGAIGLMAWQPHIREYCPKDYKERFRPLEAAEEWVGKGEKGIEGRGTFLLLSQTLTKAGRLGYPLEAYGWTGWEPCPQLPDHPITSAYRTGEPAGRHLGEDFGLVVVHATNALYAPGENIGLETWQSNKRAVEMYKRIGFVLQMNEGQQPELRETLDPNAENGKVLDTRLYMAYPPELLAV